MDNYLFEIPLIYNTLNRLKDKYNICDEEVFNIDCAIEILKRRIPLNVDEEGYNLYCPTCRRKLQRNHRNNYCPRCGQRIRWE